jgi:membrane-associated phospholipid phosphatase
LRTKIKSGMHERLTKLGLFALEALLLVVAAYGYLYLVEHIAWIRYFDDTVYVFVHTQGHTKLFDYLIWPFNANFFTPAPFTNNIPSFYYFVLALFFAYVYWKKRPIFRDIFFAFLTGVVLNYSLSQLLWHTAYRVRPFVVLPHNNFFGIESWDKLSSFPSGHVMMTALFATLMAYFIPQMKWWMVLFVAFMAYSRLYTGAHYPTDVIFGVFAGFMIARLALTLDGIVRTSRAHRRNVTKPEAEEIQEG